MIHLFAGESYLLNSLRLLIERHRWGPRFFAEVDAEVASDGDDGFYETSLDLLGTLRGVQQRRALLGDPQLQGRGGGVDVPVGEGLGEQRVHGGLGVLAQAVVGRVGLRRVVRRHLQVPTALEVDDADLDAPHVAAAHVRHRLALAPAGGQRPHEVVGVEDRGPDGGELVGPAHGTALTGRRRGRR